MRRFPAEFMLQFQDDCQADGKHHNGILATTGLAGSRSINSINKKRRGPSARPIFCVVVFLLEDFAVCM